MLNAIQSGIFNESTKKRLDELEERKNQLEVNILQEELQHPVLTKEQILFWLHKFRTTNISDKAERQRLIDSFVNAIYLYDDKIVLVWNYKDGTKTVTLKDIEGSALSLNTAPLKRPLTYVDGLLLCLYFCGFTGFQLGISPIITLESEIE